MSRPRSVPAELTSMFCLERRLWRREARRGPRLCTEEVDAWFSCDGSLQHSQLHQLPPQLCRATEMDPMHPNFPRRSHILQNVVDVYVGRRLDLETLE